MNRFLDHLGFPQVIPTWRAIMASVIMFTFGLTFCPEYRSVAGLAGTVAGIVLWVGIFIEKRKEGEE